MQQWEIKHRYTGAVLYAAGGETLRDVVVGAVKKGAYLRSLAADLIDTIAADADIRAQAEQAHAPVAEPAEDWS